MKDKTPTDFLLDHYIACREELLSFGVRFDHTLDTAEDLFVSSHDILVRSYPPMDRDDYRKLMITTMKHAFTDHFRRKVWIQENPYPESISPKSPLPLDEKVCRNEEIGFIHLALSKMSQADQEILLEKEHGTCLGIREENPQGKVVIKSYRKYQAIKRLEERVIQVMAEQKAKHQEEQQTYLGKEGTE